MSTEPDGVRRYRKRPVEIQARLFDPAANYDEACAVVRLVRWHSNRRGL